MIRYLIVGSYLVLSSIIVDFLFLNSLSLGKRGEQEEVRRGLPGHRDGQKEQIRRVLRNLRGGHQ